MNEKTKGEPSFPDAKYHEEAVKIAAIMQTEGWKAYVERLQRKKATYVRLMERGEIDLDVSAVEKKGDNVTLVVVNKDVNKIAHDFILALEREFRDLQIEAARQPEVENEQ